MERVDVVVIGSGQGGVPLAVNLAREGKSVVLFERGRLGGTCLNVGCYPSKALLAAAHLAGSGIHASKLGVTIEAQADFPRIMEVVRGKTDAGYIQRALDGAGVHTVMAAASFSGVREVTGGGQSFQAETIIINTGNSPFIPDIPGLEGTPFMTYMNFWELNELPQRLIVMGGGYIGVELGQAMARLGAETHIVEKMDRIVAKEEPDLSAILMEALQADGVSFHLSTSVTRVGYENGSFSLTLEDGGILQGGALMVAVGQKPATAALDAQASGIELTQRAFVKVDERFQTTCDGVYAIGDVTGQPAFTHVSWEDFRRLMSILKGGDRRRGDRVLGYNFYTDPEAGRCGLTIDEAQNQGYNARAVTLPLQRVARAWLAARTQGFYRLVVDSESDKILGATLVGPRAGELVHIIIDLMESGASWHVLEEAMHIHPAYAEGLPSTARQLL